MFCMRRIQNTNTADGSSTAIVDTAANDSDTSGGVGLEDNNHLTTLKRAGESYVIFNVFLLEITKCCAKLSYAHREQLMADLLLIFSSNNEEIVTMRIIYRQRLDDTIQFIINKNDDNVGLEGESSIRKLGKELLEILKPDDSLF